jgi:serine/threonine protein kinase
MLFSARGLLAGTLGYLSPEQLAVDGPPPGAPADVHALGVLMYELLAGCVPLDARRLRRASWAEVVRVVRDESPPRPSARVAGLGAAEAAGVAAQRRTEPRRLAGALRGDLDWIALKALAREPSDRYPSAGGLGRDIQRHLSGEPVAPGLRSLGRRLRRALLP